LVPRIEAGPWIRQIEPVTVLDVIQRSANFLAKRGLDSPRLQAELLLAHVLQIPRMQLYLQFERLLAPPELNAVRELVRRRGQREPLQHLLGSTSFCGLELAVDARALVPRPETEQLAELAWESLNARGQGPESAMALDFGTGSGCLAIALAVKVPTARLQAIDISADALAVARQNAGRHQVQDRIQFSLGDGFAAVPTEARFDLIVTNPPYIASAEIAALEPEVRDHDPRVALDGGAHGLDFYHRLAREAAAFLRPGGRLMAEFGDGQADAIREILVSQNWIVEWVKADYSGRPRFIVARRPD
jgi:release factor glutamine methyltransferase